jgi:hypothetical protein
LESPKDLETEGDNIENVMKTPIIPEEERNQDKNIFLLEYYEYNRIRNFWYAYEALAKYLTLLPFNQSAKRKHILMPV